MGSILHVGTRVFSSNEISENPHPVTFSNLVIKQYYAQSDNSLCSLEIIDRNDSDSLQKFMGLCAHFHISDYYNRNPNRTSFEEEQYKARVNGLKADTVKKFEDGQIQLIVIRKEEAILGGTFYMIQGNIVHMHIACLDRELPKEDFEQHFKILIEHLSNKKIFPQAERLIVFTRKYSSENEILSRLFNASSYTLPQYDNQFNVYERPVLEPEL